MADRKRILFLDDSPGRHKDIRPHTLHDAAFTAGEATTMLAANAYDIVFLDHDLGGREMVSSHGDEETGYTVAKWIAANRPAIPLVVVHSLNPAGSDNIAGLLKGHGYRVLQCGFLRLRASLPAILAWEPPAADLPEVAADLFGPIR